MSAGRLDQVMAAVNDAKFPVPLRISGIDLEERGRLSCTTLSSPHCRDKGRQWSPSPLPGSLLRCWLTAQRIIPNSKFTLQLRKRPDQKSKVAAFSPIWSEIQFSSFLKSAFNFLFQKLHKNSLPYGGKVLLLGGDLCQFFTGPTRKQGDSAGSHYPKRHLASVSSSSFGSKYAYRGRQSRLRRLAHSAWKRDSATASKT